MFVGGTDTTYTVLEWAMTELLRHPRILKKLQEEVTEIAKGKQDICESDPDKMPCLKATIKESTLRFVSFNTFDSSTGFKSRHKNNGV